MPMQPLTRSLLSLGRIEVERMIFVEGPTAAEAIDTVTFIVIKQLLDLRDKHGFVPMFILVCDAACPCAPPGVDKITRTLVCHASLMWNLTHAHLWNVDAGRQ
jgi:hypothetical protein